MESPNFILLHKLLEYFVKGVGEVTYLVSYDRGDYEYRIVLTLGEWEAVYLFVFLDGYLYLYKEEVVQVLLDEVKDCLPDKDPVFIYYLFDRMVGHLADYMDSSDFLFVGRMTDQMINLTIC